MIKKMKRIILSHLLVVAMVSSMVPVAWADETTDSARVNLALNCNTESSTFYVADNERYKYDASTLVDGELDNDDHRWAPLDEDRDPWAIIDLGSVKPVDTFVIYEWLDFWEFPDEYRCEKFTLSVSKDKSDWTEVHEGTTIGEKLTVTLPAHVDARYVKINTKPRQKGDFYYPPSLHELEIYSTPLGIYDCSVTKADSDTSYNYSFTMKSPEEVEGTFIVALYDGQGRLVGAEPITMEVAEKTYSKTNQPITTSSAAATYKIMFWENYGTLMSLCDFAEGTVAAQPLE